MTFLVMGFVLVDLVEKISDSVLIVQEPATEVFTQSLTKRLTT